MSITDFFRGKVLFITGGTAFLGQPMVAKILTALPDIQKIYLLIRSRMDTTGKHTSAQERLENELLTSDVFAALRQLHGENFDAWAQQKLTAVEGDLTHEHLGFSDAEYQKLQNEVQVFINIAGLVDFDPPFDDSLWGNALAAKHVVNFARGCQDVVFLHISTAYVCGDKPGHVPEELPLPYEDYATQHREKTGMAIPETLSEEIEGLLSLSGAIRAEVELPENLANFQREAEAQRKGTRKGLEALVEELKSEWLEERLVEEGLKHARSRGWNDTYTYMKFLGEQMIMELRGELPTAIVRPSIIESSFDEPEPGWLGKFRMSEPLIVGFGKGRLPDFPADPDIILDIIPVDFVVNAILAAAERTARRGGIEVYHVATGTQNPLYFRGIFEATYEYFVKYPMLEDGKPVAVPIWKYPSLEEFQRKLDSRMRLVDLAVQTLSKLPIRAAKRKRRQLVLKQSGIKALLHYIRIYAPYTRTNFEFETEKTQGLYDALSPTEQQRFNFNVSRIHWKRYFQEIHIPGIKRHVLKIEDNTANNTEASSAAKQEKANSQDESEESATAPESKCNTRNGNVTQGTDFVYSETKSGLSPDQSPPKTIVDLIKGQAARIPDRIALQMANESGWETYTYLETYTASRQVAWQLWESGLRKDDRVVLVSENQPEWCIAYLAAVQIGIAVVPLDAQTPAHEISAIVEFTAAKSILASESVLEKSDVETLSTPGTMLQNINKNCEIVEVSDGTESKPSDDSHRVTSETPEIPADFPNVEVSPDTVASIIFTMGTTVEAKGAMLTHGGFISNVEAVAKALPPTDTERILSALPLYHALSFSCSLLMALYSGTTATYVNALRPTTLLKTMREAKTTAFIGVPRLFQMLQGTIERQASRADTPGETLAEKARSVMGGEIRVLVSGGASLSDAIYDGFQKFGMTLYQGYGMTETAPVLSVNPYLKSKRGSVGPAVEGVELQIENPDSNGIGEIIAKGPSTMKGYYQNTDATEKAIRNGWLYTGDLGYMDADGYLYLTGHCKDIIVPASGKNVYPVELETLYRDNSAIFEMCVLGIPYEDGSDTAIHAVIVPRSPDEATKAEIQHHLQTRTKQLPSYQQFHKSHFWDDPLPKTADGSVDRQSLRRSLEAHIKNMADLQADSTADVEPAAPRSDIPEEVLSTLARLARMPTQHIQRESRLDTDLGLDSLTRLDLLLVLESRLGETIPDALLANLETVGDVVELIETFPTDTRNSRQSSVVSHQLRDGSVKRDASLTDNRRPKADNYTQVPRWYARAFRTVITGIYRNYFSLKCYGLEHIPQDKPYIIMPNHTSHLDTLTVITALGTKAYRLWTLAARDYWFATRFQGWFARTCLNALPIEREGNFTEFLHDLRAANEVMAQNNGLLIFPEGTRSLDGKLQPFKPGILSLLIYSPNIPVIPAYIEGTHHALPKGQNLPKKHPVRIVFGEPFTFPPADWGEQDKTPIDPDRYQEFLELAQNRVAELGAMLKQQEGP